VTSKYRLTREADADLKAIADHTIEQFGVAQARKYSEALFKAFDTLAVFPLLGADQNQIEPNLRRFVHASHSIYYWVDDGEVVIVSLLGPGQDPMRRFSG
jgi:toxin ParE1/3/4